MFFVEPLIFRDVKSLSFPFAALIAIGFLIPPPRALAEDAEARAWRINVPQFELREASIEESIRALAARSRTLDPAHEGVNFVWPAILPADTRLTLRLVNVPLHEVARYVARLAGMRLTPRQHALILLPDDDASAPAASRFSAAGRTAGELILARVEFRDATLPAALAYLATSARSADPRKMGVNIVVDIPPEMRDTRITLSLTSVPFGEALRYAATLANLIVVEEPYALIVTTPDAKRTPAPSDPPLAGEQNSPGAGPLGQWENPLGQRPEAASRNAARDLNGDIQPEKSGYIPLRSMGGWPLPLDPGNHSDTDSRGK
jgi:hypothetical protein